MIENKYRPILIITLIAVLIFILSQLSLALLDTDADFNNILSIERRSGDSPLNDNGEFLWLSDDSNGKWEAIIPPNRQRNNTSGYAWFKIKPADIDTASPTLYVRFSQMTCQVFYRGEEIYKYSEIEKDGKAAIPDNILHYIALPGFSSSEYVYIRTFAPFLRVAGTINDSYYGSDAEIFNYLFKKNIAQFSLSSFFIIIGLFFLVLYIIRPSRIEGFLVLGIAIASVGVWLFSESTLSSLIIDNPTILLYMSKIGVYLAPPCFLMLIYNILKPPFKWLLKALAICFPLLLCAALILDLTGTYSIILATDYYFAFLLFTAIVLLFTVIYSVIVRQNKAWFFLIGVVILEVSCLHDVLLYIYKKPNWLSPSIITHWGLLVFLLLMVFALGRNFNIVLERFKDYSIRRDANYRMLVESVQEGICILNSSYEIVYANPALADILEISEEQLYGKSIFSFIKDKKIETAVKAHNLESKQLDADILSYMGTNKSAYISTSSVMQNNKFNGTVLTFLDVTEQKRAENIIITQAYRDSLTGLYNRRYFEKKVALIENSLEDNYPLSCIVIDIDDLKIVNDILGHKMGDTLLQTSANMAADCFRADDLVARTGGDEFCVVLPTTTYENAIEKADLLLNVRNRYNSKKTSIEISMSVGVATSENPSESVHSIYKRADDKMYMEKLDRASKSKSREINLLLHALEKRDYVSDGHVKRLELYSKKMADILKLTKQETENLFLLAKIHDLGNIYLPDEILFKRDTLTGHEYTEIKNHVKTGYNMATRSKGLSHISKLILHHHERWDGTGYPEGMTGSEIPIECRILAILDSYDAMVSQRPYRNALSKNEALHKIERDSGKQFDPYITAAFLTVMRK